ncbi:hypothetical protein UY3_06040 [Chelonia mydas]|uniref:Uncharacterized protein n=1 Tax=Chelonia mydas TaxID=8469 RepID=M7C862_CHEMY|nr:hypothetical protein UY3_06040 [Chelonia mydas]
MRVRSREQEALGAESENAYCGRIDEYKHYQTLGERSYGEDKEGVGRRPWGSSPGSCSCHTAVPGGTLDSCIPQGPGLEPGVEGGPGFPPNPPNSWSDTGGIDLDCGFMKMAKLRAAVKLQGEEIHQ